MEEKEFIARIDDLRPDINWVGICTPKQKRSMDRYLGLLDNTLMRGVGAAFDLHTGCIADCSQWIKNAGLPLLHYLLRDSKHLWERYLHNNTAFLLHIFLQFTGLEGYPPHPRPEPYGALPSQPRFVGR
jgi:N-acetylglucosaminyldiphosphoundecaprenol N-acetyl-beta-D-mannosaminyltransferase